MLFSLAVFVVSQQESRGARSFVVAPVVTSVAFRPRPDSEAGFQPLAEPQCSAGLALVFVMGRRRQGRQACVSVVVVAS